MSDVTTALDEWTTAGTGAALASLVAVEGSAPQPVGAALAVSRTGRVVGSVSSGCVESAIYDAARGVVENGESRMLHFGPRLHGHEPGLTCGGRLTVFVEPVGELNGPTWTMINQQINAHRTVARAVVTQHRNTHRIGTELTLALDDHGRPADRLGRLTGDMEAAALQRLIALIQDGATGTFQHGDGHIYLRTWKRAPRLILIGADAIAASLSRLARAAGFRVTVCDPRPIFTTAERFPFAEQVVRAWPDRYLRQEAAENLLGAGFCVCVLNHDQRLDVPAIETALSLPELAYLGALGSAATHQDRLARLRQAGLSPDRIDRLRSPIGLDIGARSADEIAIAVLAEIIHDRRNL